MTYIVVQVNTGTETMAHVYSRTLILDDESEVGPFSSHWAAVAAMIRRTNPDFKSLGGDKPEDLAIERTNPRSPSK